VGHPLSGAHKRRKQINTSADEALYSKIIKDHWEAEQNIRKVIVMIANRGRSVERWQSHLF